jgi:hypothetical protein
LINIGVNFGRRRKSGGGISDLKLSIFLDMESVCGFDGLDYGGVG